jgi:hypothetical protein
MLTRTLTGVSLASAATLAVVLGLTSVRSSTMLAVASLAVILWGALLLVVTAAFACGQWRSLRWRALVPAAILFSGIPGIQGVKAIERELGDLAFGRNFTALEGMANQLALLSPGIVRLSSDELPESARACCVRAYVRRDTQDGLTAIFIVRRQLAYLYDPAGNALSRGVGRRWQQQELIAPHWYRLVR